MKFRYNIGLAIVIGALAAFVSPDEAPRSCALAVEAIDRSAPSTEAAQQLADAKTACDHATSDGERKRLAARVKQLEAAAEKSKGYLFKGVAVSEGVWQAGHSCVLHVRPSPAAVKVKVGDFVRPTEMLFTAPLSTEPLANDYEKLYECAKWELVAKPASWPDTRAVPRLWEAPAVTTTADLAAVFGDPTSHVSAPIVFYPLRITNRGKQTIRVARLIIEMRDESNFLQYVVRGVVVENLHAGDAIEREIITQRRFGSGWKPVVRPSHVEFTP